MQLKFIQGMRAFIFTTETNLTKMAGSIFKSFLKNLTSFRWEVGAGREYLYIKELLNIIYVLKPS